MPSRGSAETRQSSPGGLPSAPLHAPSSTSAQRSHSRGHSSSVYHFIPPFTRAHKDANVAVQAPAGTRQQWGKGTHWTPAVTLPVSLGSPIVGLLLENEAEILLALTSPDVVCGLKCEADSPSAEAADAQGVALSHRGHLGKGTPWPPETRTGRILVALDAAPEHMWPWPQPHSILLLLQHLWGPIDGPARTWTFGSGATPPPAPTMPVAPSSAALPGPPAPLCSPSLHCSFSFSHTLSP